jgi:hypothetical protein
MRPEVAAIPPIRGARPETSQPVRRRSAPRVGRHGLSRRDFLRAAAVTGVATGMWVVGLLPPARRAWAGHGSYGYRIKPLPCPNYNCYSGSAGGSCGDPDICCPSEIHSNACIDDPGKHFYGYHKSGSGWDLRPDECVTNTKDGWAWSIAGGCGRCDGCAGTYYRCHDGVHIHSGGGRHKSVCKWIYACANCGCFAC